MSDPSVPVRKDGPYPSQEEGQPCGFEETVRTRLRNLKSASHTPGNGFYSEVLPEKGDAERVTGPAGPGEGKRLLRRIARAVGLHVMFSFLRAARAVGGFLAFILMLVVMSRLVSMFR